MNTPEKMAAAFSDAVVAEIKAEMGRQDIRSVRALAEKTEKNHVYWNDRLNKTPATRVLLNTKDISRLSSALGLDPLELVRRATDATRAKPTRRRSTGT